MTTRKILAALSAAALLTTVSACGREAESEGPKSEAAAVEEGQASGELTVWAMGAEGEKLPELVKKFEEANPDVTVNVTAVPWDSAHDKFTAAIAAGTTPDVAQVGTTWMGEFVGLDALDAVPDLIDEDKFFEGAQQTTVVNDVSYGVPWYVETRMLYYRTDIAEQAGITGPAEDWEGLKDMAKAMQDEGDATWGISLQPGGTGSWQTVLPLMWANGGQVVNDDATEFVFDSPENVEALTYYQSFFEEGIANKAPAQGTTEQDFVSGKVPMFISGPWMMAAVEDTSGEADFADKYDVALMPEKESRASFVGGSNLAVFKDTKNRDAAWKLVDFLTEEQTQIDWFELTTDLPSVESAWDSKELQADEKLAKFGEQLKTAFAPPAIRTWEQVAEAFDAQVEKVTVTGADVAEALGIAQKDADSIGMD